MRGDDDGEDLSPRVLLGLALALTLLLSVWAAFLVPLRIGDVPVPVWLVPTAGMLAVAARAGRRGGLTAALAPALVWLAVTWLAFATQRPEGDLVVPATVSGYAYLYGGLLAWLVVVVRASARPASPRRRTGR